MPHPPGPVTGETRLAKTLPLSKTRVQAASSGSGTTAPAAEGSGGTTGGVADGRTGDGAGLWEGGAVSGATPGREAAAGLGGLKSGGRGCGSGTPGAWLAMGRGGGKGTEVALVWTGAKKVARRGAT